MEGDALQESSRSGGGRGARGARRARLAGDLEPFEPKAYSEISCLVGQDLLFAWPMSAGEIGATPTDDQLTRAAL